MAPIYVRTFRVRHYECDAYGHVNNSQYLRYMQETAFDAAAAVGYGLDRHAALGRRWLTHRTDIEYLAPLGYGDSVEVKTWIVDFGQVRSRRAYELTRAGSGELAARAETDWVFVDVETGRPARIPADLVRAFFPDGAPPPAPARTPFPALPPAPAGVFRMRRRVRWHDVDPAQHVNNAAYLAYVEDCGVEVMEAHGWPSARAAREGFGVIPRRHQIEYQRPAALGDEIEVATWFSGPKRATATRHYVMTRVADGALVTRVHTLYVWVDLTTGRPRRIPLGLMADFAANQSSG